MLQETRRRPGIQCEAKKSFPWVRSLEPELDPGSSARVWDDARCSDVTNDQFGISEETAL